MELKDYTAQALVTAERRDQDYDLEHASMGMTTEAGELVDNLKRRVVYGKALDIPNLIEEVGDCLWYAALALDVHDIELRLIADNALENPATGRIFDNEFEEVMGLSVAASGFAATLMDRGSVREQMNLIFAYIYMLHLIAQRHGFTLEAAADANIAKLRERFKGKFSQDAAINRDLEAERKVLEQAA